MKTINRMKRQPRSAECFPVLDMLEPRLLVSGDFDFAMTSTGPVHVAQGHDMFVEIDLRTMGTNPSDRVISLTANSPSPQFTFDWVNAGGIPISWGSTFWIGANNAQPYTGATWLKISAATNAPLGAAIITIGGVDSLGILPQHYVAPAISIIVDPAPTAPPTATFNGAPIPITPPTELATVRPDPVAAWESQMTSLGHDLAANSYLSTHPAGRWSYSNVWFYDAARVFYQVGAYTGQQTYYDGAKSPVSGAKGANVQYEAFAQNGLMGYEYFGLGIAMDYQHSANDPAQQTADFNALQNLVNLDGGAPANNPSRMRESSYTIETYLAGKSIGCTVNDTVLKFYVDNLLGQFDQQFVSRRITGDTDNIVWNNIEPFMSGLASEALIDYYKYTVSQGTPDYRIPPAIKAAADWLTGQTWNTQTQSYQYNAYDPAGGDFYYLITYPDGNVNNIAGSQRMHVNDSAGGGPDSDQELNFLYADMFGFLYKTYGENNGSQYRVWGDKLFTYGTLTQQWIGYGKGYSQSYRQTFDYVQDRLNEPWSQPAAAPAISTFQEKFDSTLNVNYVAWATSTPTSSEVDWGTSPGSLTNQAFNENNWIAKNHRQEFTGLTPGQTYYYQVKAKDANGQITTSAVRSFVAGASVSSVSVAATTANCTENSSSGVFTLTRTSTTGTLTVNYTLGSLAGTQAAVNGVDYQALSGSVTFANGSATATVTVTPINNATAQATRSVVLTINEGAGMNVDYGSTSGVSNNSATVYILDDENPIPTVTVGCIDNHGYITPQQAANGDGSQKGTYRITRSGSTASALTVYYRLDPNYGLVPGVDYQAMPGSAVIPAGSNYVDVDYIPLSRDGAVGYKCAILQAVVPSSVPYVDGNGWACIYVESGGFEVEVTASDPVNPGSGTFTITRTAPTRYWTGTPDYNYPVTVTWNVGGTAVSGTDYTISNTTGSYTFPATTATTPQTYTITVTPNFTTSVNKTVTLSLTPSVGCGWAPHVPGPASVDSDRSTGTAAMEIDKRQLGTDLQWVNDSIPAGSNATDYGFMYPAAIESWNWVTTNPAPYSGTQAHQSSIAAGMHGSLFQDAPSSGSNATGLKINKGDWIYTYVYLDPANMPSELMLKFQSNDMDTYDGWNHIVYWGTNNTNLLSDQAYCAGALPSGGAWVRLAIEAKNVGMEGKTLTGVAYLNYNGRATWDATGKNSAVTNPAAPTNLVATVPAGMGKVDLSWTNNAGSNACTNIYRELDNGNWFLIGRTGPGATTFQDSGQGGQYWNNLSGTLVPVDGNFYNWNGNAMPPNAPVIYRASAYMPSTYAESGNSYTVAYSNDVMTLTNADTVWFSDTLPAGATAYGDTDGWNWVTNSNPPPFIGTAVHQSAIASGTHDHYFSGATNGLAISTGDKLYTYVFLDPANMPSEVMLQFQDSGGSWEHRAYWGANSIALGTDGTNSRRHVGALPSGGVWVRLEVPASQLGLEGLAITGVKYTLYNGRATWDNTGKTGAAGAVIVQAPSGLSATAVSSTQINLAWTDNASNETGFKVYRSTDNVTFSLVQTIATANTQSYSDTGLSAATQYWYKVTAYGTGESAYSNTANATTPVATPAAPSGLGATAVSSSQINLAWTDNSNNETGFKIDRATDSGFTQNLVTNTVGANVTTYSATSLAASTTYYFRVRATNSAGDSANTTTASATTAAAPQTGSVAIGVPNFSFEQNTGTWGTATSWTGGFAMTDGTWNHWNNQDGTTRMGLWWGNGTITQTLTTTAVAGTSYTLTVAPSNYYCDAPVIGSITLSAGGVTIATVSFNETNTSLTAADVVATGVAPTNAAGLPLTITLAGDNGSHMVAFDNVRLTASLPEAPTGLSATPASSSQINLSWTDNSTSETGFIIDRATDSGFAQNLTTSTVGANVTTYNATGLAASTTYYFRVRSTNAIGDSANSTAASATTQAASQGGTVTVTVPNYSFEQNGGSWNSATSWTGGFAMGDEIWGHWNNEDGTYRMGLWWGNGTITQTLTTTAVAGATYTLTVAPSNYYSDAPVIGTITLSAGGVTIATASFNETASSTGAPTYQMTAVDVVATGVAPSNAAGQPITITLAGDNGSHMVAFDNVRLTATLSQTAPSNLSAVVASGTQINLSWTDNSSSETGFAIDRATDSGFTQNLVTSTVGANVTSFSATGLTANTTYYFRVRATSSGGDSANSNTAMTISVPNYSFESNTGSWGTATGWTGGFAMGDEIWGHWNNEGGTYRMGLWWGNGTISQTLTTTAVAGATYTLTVAPSNYYSDTPVIGSITLSAGGVTIATMSFNESASNLGAPTYQLTAADIVAMGLAPTNAAGQQLTITLAGDNGSHMIAFDNIRLTVSLPPV